MGRHKLSLELAAGKALGLFALEAMLHCREIAEIVAVVREDDDLAWASQTHVHEWRAKLCIATYADADQGMAYSLRYGLAQALKGAAKTDAVLVVLADQPFITSELLGSLAEEFARDRSLDYVACSCNGTPHPPALLSAAMFPAVESLIGDAGARKLLTDAAWRGKLVDVNSAAVFGDVDTPDDLYKLQRLMQAHLVKTPDDRINKSHD